MGLADGVHAKCIYPRLMTSLKTHSLSKLDAKYYGKALACMGNCSNPAHEHWASRRYRPAVLALQGTSDNTVRMVHRFADNCVGRIARFDSSGQS